MKIFDKVTTLIQQKIVPDFLLHARSPKLSPSWSIKNSADVVLKKKSCFGFLFFESLRRQSSRKYKFPKKQFPEDQIPWRISSQKTKFSEDRFPKGMSSQKTKFLKYQVSKVPSMPPNTKISHAFRTWRKSYKINLVLNKD